MLPMSATFYILTLLGIQFFACFADVVLDACMVEESMYETNDRKGVLQSSTWWFRSSGLAVAIFCGAAIYEFSGADTIFLIQAVVYLFQSYTASLTTERGEADNSVPTITIHEEDGSETVISSPIEPEWGSRANYMKRKNLTLKQHIFLVVECVVAPHIRNILLFNFLRELKPTGGLAIFFYQLDVLKFTPRDIGAIGFVAELTKAMSIGVYQKFFRRIARIQTTTLVGFILSFVLSMLLPLALMGQVATYIPLFWFFMLLWSVESAVDEIIVLPLMISTTFTSDRDVAGTVYSTNLAIGNLAEMINAALSGLIMHSFRIDHGKFTNLLTLLLVTNSFSLLYFIILFLVPNLTLEELADKYERERIEGNKGAREGQHIGDIQPDEE